MTRPVGVRVVVVLASIVLVLGVLVGYASRAAFNSDQFANRATAALEDSSVRALLAQEITDQVILKNADDLIAARPIIESATSSLLGSRAFTGLFRAAVEDVHRAVFDRDQDTVTLTLADIGTVLGAALEKLAPEVAKEVKATSGDVEVLKEDIGSATADLARTARSVRALALVFLILWVGLAGTAIAISPDRRGTTGSLGFGAAMGAVVLLVTYATLRSIALSHVEGAEQRDAAGAIWDAFLGDLKTAAWVLGASGAVVAAAAASLLKPVELRDDLARAAAAVTREPATTLGKVLRAALLVAAGLGAILEPDAVIQLVVVAVGLFLVYQGVDAILRLIYKPPKEGEAEARAALVRERFRARRRKLLIPVIAGALIVAMVSGFFASGAASTAAPARGGCNGHEELCGRSLDRVALAATHNAMSVPLPGWYSSEQDAPIADQMEAGVRGLLIDTHYADKLSGGDLRTYFGPDSKPKQVAKEDGISPEAVDAAMRIRDRLFSGEGERGMYLCHTFCELGGTSLESVLEDIHDFLVTHPDDVLVVINQDYVTPEDFTKAVEDANLGDFAYTGPVSGELPTLREMIDSGQRVVFLAENHAGVAPWYRLAYKQLTEETPYTFNKPSLLIDPDKLAKSCKPNRGPEDAPLFLMNHWVSTDPIPLPSSAREVNAYEPLLRRARECAERRDHFVNLVAVNFYRQGDVFRVVDELNGLGGG